MRKYHEVIYEDKIRSAMLGKIVSHPDYISCSHKYKNITMMEYKLELYEVADRYYHNFCDQQCYYR